MTKPRPTIKTVDGRRTFACVPAAVTIFLIDSEEHILLLSHPQRDRWELVSGALEHDEIIWDAARRPLLRQRAIDLYRLWKDDPPSWDQLQPPLDTNRVVQRR